MPLSAFLVYLTQKKNSSVRYLYNYVERCYKELSIKDFFPISCSALFVHYLASSYRKAINTSSELFHSWSTLRVLI